MTTVDLKKNWTQALAFLKRDIQETSYEMWIAPLKPHSYDEENGIFELLLADGVPANVMDRYTESIENALFSVFGKKAAVHYLTSDDLPRTRKTPQTDSIFTDEFYLNPRYIFSSFVVGPNNQLAYATAVAVASMPGGSYNPLFLYGGSGLGKTHLMHAIGHQVRQNSPKKKVLYVSSEMFLNEFLQARQTNKWDEFRNKYRKVDVLLIDDIQFIAGKKETQEEFFHTFEALYDDHKQIVITADRPAKEIEGLQERLVTRFEWGLPADIEPPEYETRVAILRKKAEQENMEITEEMNEVFSLIADRVHSNIRELEGALNRIIAFSALMNQPISKQLARTALRDLFSDENVVITPNIIKKTVAKHFGIKISDLDSQSRQRQYAYPRQIAMYLCKEMTELSYPKIGDTFGGKDHTTCMYACEKIAHDIKTDESLRLLIDQLTSELREE